VPKECAPETKVPELKLAGETAINARLATLLTIIHGARILMQAQVV
jgi:hypothetical protein